jgi:hypothetical protein
MSTTTRLGTRPASDWRRFSACRDTDLDTLFSDKKGTQERVQGICRGCPVRTSCLVDVLDYEADNCMRWAVVGGLTTVQRRALRCEALLGNRPNLAQARQLASPRWASVMMPLRYRGLSPVELSAELRRHSIIATPVTVRLAVWWAGGKGGVVPRRGPGDERHLWELVRDHCREVAEELRRLGAGKQDVAAYLGVSEDSLAKAITAWRAADVEQVAA